MRRGILADADELKALRGLIAREPFNQIYDTLETRCSLILESAPVTETQWRTYYEKGTHGPAIHAARVTQGRIIDLVVAHNIDPNAAYRDRAIEELDNLVKWTQWVDPCNHELPADLCTAECAVGAVIGLDWLWDDLPEAKRRRTLQAIRTKAIEPYIKAVRDGADWYTCSINWNAVVNSGCGLAALALSDEDPAAHKAYLTARSGLVHFFGALGREGGWDEGTGYWGYAMRYLLLLSEASCRKLDDQSLLHRRGMDVTGLFPVYFTPNGQAASFGDAPTVPLHGAFYLLARHFGLNEIVWWLDTYAFRGDASTTDYSAAGLAMLFRPVETPAKAKVELQAVKTFNQIGWAAMADHWPRPTMYVAAKTGNLSGSHSHRDMNSIQLQVDGEMLLTDQGSRAYSADYFSESRGGFYDVQARAHNTITIAGRDHDIDARGSIVESDQGPDYRWVVCDAGSACGDAAHFQRHLVMLVSPAKHVGRMLIVLDDLRSPVPEDVDVYWHTRGRIELADQGQEGTIIGQAALLHFAMATTFDCELSVKDEPSYGNGRGHFLNVSGPKVSRALMASVFSRRPVRGKIELARTDTGDVQVKVGSARVQFKAKKRQLRFQSVKA